MKHIVAAFLILLCFGAKAQDRILTVDGDEIWGKIIEIDTGSIRYNPKDTQKQVVNYLKEVREIRIKDVFMVTYANGSKDVFTENIVKEKPESEKADFSEMSAADLYELGTRDAKLNYNGTGTFAGSAVCGVFNVYGLLPAAIIAAVPPNPKPEKVEHPGLLKSADYNRGYRRKAHGLKLLNVAGGYTAGILFDIILLYAILVIFG